MKGRLHLSPCGHGVVYIDLGRAFTFSSLGHAGGDDVYM